MYLKRLDIEHLAINGKRALQRFLAYSEEEQRLLYIQLDQYGPSGVVRHQPRQAKSSPFLNLPGEIRNQIYNSRPRCRCCPRKAIRRKVRCDGNIPQETFANDGRQSPASNLDCWGPLCET